MAKLLNYDTQAEEDVPEADVTAAVASGRYALPSGEVPVIFPDGSAGTVPSEKAAEAFRQGYRLETSHEQTLRDAGESPGTAFAAGAARGASFGLSDLALTKTGLTSPERLSALKEANPLASPAGEIAGTVLPMLIPGGQATAAGAAARLGGAAERVGAKLLGKGLAGRVGAKALGGAVEGGLFGMGAAVTESALDDSELTAEKLLSGAGVGAMIGGLGGGGVELAGAGLKAAGRKLIGKGADEAGALVGEAAPATQAGSFAEDVAKEAPSTLADALAEARANPEGAARKAKDALEGAANDHAGTLKKVAEALDLDFPTSEGWVLRDLDLKQREIKKLGMKELTEDAPRLLLDDARYAQAKTLKDKVALIRTKQEEAGLAMSDAVSRLDGVANKGERFNSTEVAARARKELLAPLESGPALNEPVIAALEKEIQKLEEGGGMTFSKAEALKRGYDPHLRWDSGAPGPVKDGLRKLRGMINGEIEAKAEEVAISRGDMGIFDNWKIAKKEYGAMAELGNLAEHRLAAKGGNRELSLTDNLWGSAGFVAGGGLNPIGLAMGAGAAVLNKWGRERLPHILALATDKLERGGGVAAVKKLLEDTPLLGTVANAFKKSVDAALAKSPQAFGSYTGILSNAAARGAADLFSAHAKLASESGEYGAIMAKAGFPLERPEENEGALRRAGGLTRVQQAVAQHDERITEVVDGFLRGRKGERTEGKKLKESRETFERRAAELARLASDPQALADRFRISSQLSLAAPGVAAAASATLGRAITFLHEKAPKSPHAPNMPALAVPWKPTDAELGTWEKYMRAVERPTTVLEDLQRGTVSKEAVEALQVVYPKLHDDLKQKMIERMGNLEGRLPFRQRQALSALFGPEFDGPSPAARAVLQQAHKAAVAQEAAKSRAPMPSAATRSATSLATQTQRLEGRGG